jgi:4-hydroxybenzoate polyprenyltransferase
MARHTIPDIIERSDPQPGIRVDSGRSLPFQLFFSLRPAQWTKNLVVFAALIFGQRNINGRLVGTLVDAESVLLSVEAFVIFCALSGVVYLINDIADRDADRLHPLKKSRPIASGAVSVTAAVITALVLGVGALAWAFSLRISFGVLAAAYLVLQTMYSSLLKRIVIIDVLTIAIGFVLRAAAGAAVIAVAFSEWLLIMTILLALFLALSKRRHELVLLADGATGHRAILQEYSPYLLDQMISVVTASTLVAYAIYTVSPETIAKFHTNKLGLTLPFPLYGIFRYLYLVHQKEGGGSPSDMLLNDRPLLVCVGLWVISLAIIIYGPRALFPGAIS